MIAPAPRPTGFDALTGVGPVDTRRTESGLQTCPPLSLLHFASFLIRVHVSNRVVWDQEYKDSEPNIDLWGSTAVAAYSWEIAYDMSGESYRASGWDVFVFVRENAPWLAVWRTIIAAPQRQ